MDDCIFCKIINGEIPSTKVYEDEKVLGFKDLNPMAKIHNLFIHKDHTKNAIEISQTNPEQFGDIFKAISKYAADLGLDESGLRIVTNVGPDAGQTVFHTHFHVLAGERLGAFGS